MICLIAIVVLLVMVSNRNQEIRQLKGQPEPDNTAGCLFLVLVGIGFLIFIGMTTA